MVHLEVWWPIPHPRFQPLALPRRGSSCNTGHIPSLQCSEPSVAPTSLREGTRVRTTAHWALYDLPVTTLPSLSAWLAWLWPPRPPHAPSAAHQQSHTHCLVWFSVGFFFSPFHLFPSSLAHFLCARHHANHSPCISPFHPHIPLRHRQYYCYPCSIKGETEAQRGVLACPGSPRWEMAEPGSEPHAGWAYNTETLSCQLVKSTEP